ncbi:FecR domain-containing protein [Lentisphaera profundi]|uniref:FecR domain-containing protein n=1 Tax=Lentisphaera profundi TaxID=1658616 RepID=A0ABY7VVC3_9BACT|nr:LamG-like jellyroll fold domain-containing protein [Lentisphaera profundi]WDE98175.1 FecR domain-containing protein [Lentisphaera profundi]
MDIEKLAEAYLRDDLSENQRQELKKLLASDDQRSKKFVEYLYETGQILNASEQLKAIEPHLKEVEKIINKSASRAFIYRVASMAAIFLGALIFWQVSSPQKAETIVNADSSEPVLEPFLARVNSTEEGIYSSGDWLKKGAYVFDKKLALTLDSGVELNIEANSALELESSNRVRLSKGKVRVYVPQVAVGFVLNIPGGKVVDLGTEFMVGIDDRGLSDVEVIQGEVEVYPMAEENVRKLIDNERISISSAGLIQSEHKALAPMASLPNLLEKRDLSYVHWPFNEAEFNWTPTASGGEFHDRFKAELMTKGKSEGPQFSEGAFGYALDFDGDNDWAVTNFKGVSGSRPRTVSFWIKIPKDAKKGENYSFVSWGNSREKGQKWQIAWNARSKDGVMGAIRTEFKEGYVIGETDLRDGRWHHVVSLFIGGDNADVASHIRHYIDGRLEAVSGSQGEKVRTNIDSIASKPVAFGRKMDGPKSFLRAKLDELYIINAAVTPRQVRRLMERNSLY